MKARFHKGLLFSNIPVLCLLSRVNTNEARGPGVVSENNGPKCWTPNFPLPSWLCGARCLGTGVLGRAI